MIKTNLIRLLMNLYLLATIILSFILLSGCSASQTLTYKNNSDTWNIQIERGSFSGQFEVIINDEIVLEETPNIFTKSIDETEVYNGSQIRLIVNHTTDLFGSSNYVASVYVDGNFITQMNF